MLNLLLQLITCRVALCSVSTTTPPPVYNVCTLPWLLSSHRVPKSPSHPPPPHLCTFYHLCQLNHHQRQHHHQAAFFLPSAFFAQIKVEHKLSKSFWNFFWLTKTNNHTLYIYWAQHLYISSIFVSCVICLIPWALALSQNRCRASRRVSLW